MGINRACYIYRTTFYAMCDKWTTYPTSLWMDPGVVKFARVRTKGLIDNWPNVVNTKWARRNDEDRNRGPALSQFFEGGSIPQGFAGHKIIASTMIAAMSILVRLKYAHIHVVGADFDMDADSPYCVPCLRSDAEAASTNVMFDDLNEVFAALKPLCDERGVEINNCTPATKLDVFDYKPLPEAAVAAWGEWPEAGLEWSHTRDEVNLVH